MYIDVPRALEDGLLFGYKRRCGELRRPHRDDEREICFESVGVTSKRQIFPKDDAGSNIKDGIGLCFVYLVNFISAELLI